MVAVAKAPREPITLSLNGRDFKIRPLNLAQMEDLEEHIVSFNEKRSRGERVSDVGNARGVLQIVLRRDHGGVAEDDIEGDMLEITEALKAIFKFAGFVPAGESRAAAPSPALTSERSEAA